MPIPSPWVWVQAPERSCEVLREKGMRVVKEERAGNFNISLFHAPVCLRTHNNAENICTIISSFLQALCMVPDCCGSAQLHPK